MAEGGHSENRFLRFLSRIRTSGPADAVDEGRIKRFAVNKRTRKEDEIVRNRENIPFNQMENEFMGIGHGGQPVPVYDTAQEGLAASGWAEIPDGGVGIGGGTYGDVQLAYKVREA